MSAAHIPRMTGVMHTRVVIQMIHLSFALKRAIRQTTTLAAFMEAEGHTSRQHKTSCRVDSAAIDDVEAVDIAFTEIVLEN
eukprot:6208664-Pleurochrysis_carterae.AAC.2